MDQVGQQLGNYRLIRLLGQGGFADVYLGEHIFLKTQAAIKVLQRRMTQGDIENFSQEARTIAQLKHPHIVRILDFGVDGATSFLVMDFAPHGTLRDRHPRGSLVPVPTILAYVKQIASALQYAHDQKMIHRDVKPENMLMGSNNTLLLSDFGIAIPAHKTQSLSSQEVIGTTPYMAPEQIRGQARPASDQYALAIVVYEWLTGIRPFDGSIAIEIAMRHVNDPPPLLRQKVPTISPQIEQVVLTALAKDPMQRFVTIAAFATALEQACQMEYLTLSSLPPEMRNFEPQSQPSATSQASGFLPTAPALRSIWQQMQSEEERRLFLLATFFPEATDIPLWLLALAAGLGEPAGRLEPAEQVCQHLKTLTLFAEVTDRYVRLQPAVHESGRRLAQNNANQSRAYAEAAGQRMLRACRMLNVLEQWARQADYDTCVRQVHQIRAYMDLLGLAEQSKQVAQVEGWLNQERALLTDPKWWPDPLPDLFCQQLYNRSVADGSPLIKEKEPVRWLRQTTSVGVNDPMRAGHTAKVNCVAFSPDGQLALSGSLDKTVRLWEVSSGRELCCLEGHTDQVSSVTFSPNGQMVLSASGDSGSLDNTVRLWELKSRKEESSGELQPGGWGQSLSVSSGREVGCLPGHTRGVSSVAFSPNGRLALSGSLDKTVRLWYVNSERELRCFKGPTEPVYSVAFSPDGQQVLFGLKDGTVHLWDVTSGRELRYFKASKESVMSVAFSPDGRLALSSSSPYNGSSYDTVVCLWEVSSGRKLRHFKGHKNHVMSMAISPDGRLALSGSHDGTVRLWDLGRGREHRRLIDQMGRVKGVAFSPDGRLALALSEKQAVHVWEVSSGRELLGLQGYTQAMFSPNGQLLTGSQNGTICVLDVNSGRELRRFNAPTGWVYSMTCSPDGRLVSFALDSGVILLWDLDGGRELRRLESHMGRDIKVMFSLMGNRFFLPQMMGPFASGT